MSSVSNTAEIEISEPVSGGYKEIYWYKGNRDHRLFRYKEDTFEFYHNELCDGGVSQCSSSTKGYVDTSTGTLTLYTVNISNGGNYYYNFAKDDVVDTGVNYEILLEVYGGYQC